ncbi:hypothetical protein [Pontibaca salina]|uniref:Uncharacterized protein n=1 Tax=Pontibaca salina TaxID=2795731 RepID=A0A934HS94_9RHOB|nr:hypothetical protein [Pontibaca salina]MBI6629931.1 hypothetical protein [Pontibaca salina]
MPKITKAMLRGKTREQIQTMVVNRFDAGKLTQKEFNKASKSLERLNAGKVLTDEQMIRELANIFG